MTENNDNNPTSTPAPVTAPEPVTTPEPPVIDDAKEQRLNKNVAYYHRNQSELVEIIDRVSAIDTPTKELTVTERVDNLERGKVADKIIAATGISADDFSRYIKGNSESELLESAISFLERDAARSKQGEGKNPVVPGTDKPYATSTPAPALPQYSGKDFGTPASQIAQEVCKDVENADWFKELS